MRVGSGGVMLPHYSPLKVAENFGVLAGLFPGRIDLGIGRARRHRPDDDATRCSATAPRRCPTTSPSSSPSCSPTSSAASPAGHPFARLAETLPGDARDARAVAARLLARRARSGPANSACPTPSPTSSTPRGAPIAEVYRRGFVAGQRLAEPRLAVAVWAVVAETEEEARAALGQLADGLRPAAPRPA